MATVLVEKDFPGVTPKSKAKRLDESVFGDKVGLFASLFGCWHKKLTRPFADGKNAYCACLECGARKPFDPETLQTDRHFYYPPIVNDVKVE